MKFIKINLNQTVSKAQLEHLKDEQKRWYVFGGICILFLSTFIWLFVVSFRLSNVISNREDTINDIVLKTEALQSTGKINLSKTDINNLYKTEKKRILWAEKLMELSKITPDDMAITKLEFKGKKLIISAVSSLSVGEKEFSVVESFMKRIDENAVFNKNFKDIKFDNLDKEYSKGSELLSFQIEAKLK